MVSTERRLLRHEELLVDISEQRGKCEWCAHFVSTSAGFGKCKRGSRDIDARRGEWCAKFEQRGFAPGYDREAVIARARADAEQARQERSAKLAATRFWQERAEALGLEVDEIAKAAREHYQLDNPGEQLG